MYGITQLLLQLYVLASDRLHGTLHTASPRNASDICVRAGAASAAEMAAERECASVHTNIEELLQRLNAARLPGSDTASSPSCVFDPPSAAEVMEVDLPK